MKWLPYIGWFKLDDETTLAMGLDATWFWDGWGVVWGPLLGVFAVRGVRPRNGSEIELS